MTFGHVPHTAVQSLVLPQRTEPASLKPTYLRILVLMLELIISKPEASLQVLASEVGG